MTSSEGSEVGVDERHGSMSEELLSQIQKLSKDVENIWSEVRRYTVFFVYVINRECPNGQHVSLDVFPLNQLVRGKHAGSLVALVLLSNIVHYGYCFQLEDDKLMSTELSASLARTTQLENVQAKLRYSLY